MSRNLDISNSFTLEDLRATVLKNPEALAAYEDEKIALAEEMELHNVNSASEE
jgi:hypothetical protein